MADPFQLVGTTIDGTVQIEKAIGEGGFGVVYRAKHLSFGEPVAVKVLKLPGTLDGKQREVFLNKFQLEARILYKLSQTTLNVVRPIHFGSTETASGWAPYCVMEWLEGEGLEDAIISRRKRIERGEIPRGRTIGDLRPLLDPLVSALDAAHAMGVVHRDIKPPNVFLLGGSDAPKSVKLLDFGIAKMLDFSDIASTSTLSTGTLLALTPEYAAPEQWDKSIGPVGPHTDIYALALMALELLADQHPHLGLSPSQRMFAACNPQRRPTPRSLNLQVSDEIEALFNQALSVDPNTRSRSAGQWWGALVQAAERSKGPSVVASQEAFAQTAFAASSPSGASPLTGPAPPSYLQNAQQQQGPTGPQQPGMMGSPSASHPVAPNIPATAAHGSHPVAGYTPGTGPQQQPGAYPGAPTPTGGYGPGASQPVAGYGPGPGAVQTGGYGHGASQPVAGYAPGTGPVQPGYGPGASQPGTHPGAAPTGGYNPNASAGYAPTAHGTGPTPQTPRTGPGDASWRKQHGPDASVASMPVVQGTGPQTAPGGGGGGGGGLRIALIISAVVIFLGGSGVLAWALFIRDTGSGSGSGTALAHRGQDPGSGAINKSGTGGKDPGPGTGGNDPGPGTAGKDPGPGTAGKKVADKPKGPPGPCDSYPSVRKCARAVEALYKKKKYKASLALAQHACKRGDAFGCNELGMHHLNGKGVSRDRARAATLFANACKGGIGDGCYNIGDMHRRGKGVPKDGAKSDDYFKRAFTLYSGGCGKGSAEDCRNLAHLYQWARGVAKNLPLAAQNYKRGCEGKDVPACRWLAYFYERGWGGLGRSLAKARKHYTWACKHGDGRSCGSIGVMYWAGTGVGRNPKLARYWLGKACTNGHPKACAWYRQLRRETRYQRRPRWPRYPRRERNPRGWPKRDPWTGDRW